MSDNYESFYEKYKNLFEQKTNTFCSYGRGFLIFYNDEAHKDMLIQFNLTEIFNTSFADNEFDLALNIISSVFFFKNGYMITKWRDMTLDEAKNLLQIIGRER